MTITLRWCDQRPNHVEKRFKVNVTAGPETFIWTYAGQYYKAKKGTYWIVETFYTGQRPVAVPTEQEAKDLLWFLCHTSEKT